jgi:hypothetical protein
LTECQIMRAWPIWLGQLPEKVAYPLFHVLAPFYVYL